jgi:hypothetical protein
MLEFLCAVPDAPPKRWYSRFTRQVPAPPAAPRADDRKLRLFACACCRWIWDRITEDWGRHAVETAERFADGFATADELNMAHRRACEAFGWNLTLLRSGSGSYPEGAMEAACFCAHPVARTCAERTSHSSVAATGMACEDIWDFLYGWKFQSELLKDLFGNPFRPAPAIEPAWSSWHEGTIPKLAADIYNGRAFDRLPMLADALEDAGCGQPEILAHFRDKGPHARGCRMLDVLLTQGGGEGSATRPSPN